MENENFQDEGKPGKTIFCGETKDPIWKILLEPGVWDQLYLRITCENEQKCLPLDLGLIGPLGAQVKLFFEVPWVFSVGHKLIHTQAGRYSVVRSRHHAWIQDH